MLLDHLERLRQRIQHLADSGKATVESMDEAMRRVEDRYCSLAAAIARLPDEKMLSTDRTIAADLERIVVWFELLLLETTEDLPVPVDKELASNRSFMARLKLVMDRISHLREPNSKRRAIIEAMHNALASKLEFYQNSMRKIQPHPVRKRSEHPTRICWN